jgi:16S rRNA processing protein RimM
MENNNKILVGKIVAAQGLRGEMRVQTFTSTPSDLALLKTGVKFIRAAGTGVAIVSMDGVSDRDSAERMRGTELFADRSEFPKLKKGEHYITDLIGMKVGNHTVEYVHNFGAGDILELDNGDMISFDGAVVDYDKKEIMYER